MTGDPYIPEIWPARAICMTCGKLKQVLGFDTSNEDCSPNYGFICRECINAFLDRFQDASQSP